MNKPFLAWQWLETVVSPCEQSSDLVLPERKVSVFKPKG